MLQRVVCDGYSGYSVVASWSYYNMLLRRVSGVADHVTTHVVCDALQMLILPCSIVKLLVNMLALEHRLSCYEFPAQRDDDATTCSPWSTVRGRYQRHDMFSLESLDTNYTYLPDVIERDTNYTTCSPWSIVDTNCTNVMSVGTVPWTLTVRCRVRRDGHDTWT